MENMSPESLLRKAQSLGDDIKEMESIYVLGAYYQAQTTIKTNRRKNIRSAGRQRSSFLCKYSEWLERICLWYQI